MSPTIAHALLGGSIAIILHALTQNWDTEKKFTERMVIIFAFNSMIGPDIFTMLYAFHLGDFANTIIIKQTVHSILGWPIWCLAIMWLWYYVINLRSTEETKLSKRSTLLLLIAAGEMHFYLDMLDDGVNLIGFASSSIRVSLQDSFLIGESYPTGPLTNIMPWFSMSELFLIGLFFMILLIFSLFRWQLKYTFLTAGIFLITILGCYLLFGSNIVGNENDFGITIYFGGLFVLPFLMMILAME